MIENISLFSGQPEVSLSRMFDGDSSCSGCSPREASGRLTPNGQQIVSAQESVTTGGLQGGLQQIQKVFFNNTSKT